MNAKYVEFMLGCDESTIKVPNKCQRVINPSQIQSIHVDLNDTTSETKCTTHRKCNVIKPVSNTTNMHHFVMYVSQIY